MITLATIFVVWSIVFWCFILPIMLLETLPKAIDLLKEINSHIKDLKNNVG